MGYDKCRTTTISAAVIDAETFWQGKTEGEEMAHKYHQALYQALIQYRLHGR